MTDLVKNWSTVIPPAAAVKTPEEVTKLVKTIELESQKLIDKGSTQAQK
jgi:hypothetical protein